MKVQIELSALQWAWVLGILAEEAVTMNSPMREKAAHLYELIASRLHGSPVRLVIK